VTEVLFYHLQGKKLEGVLSDLLERSLERNAADLYNTALLAAAYAQAGRQDEAKRQAQTVRKIDPRFDSADFGSLFHNARLREKLGAALKKAGL